MTSLIGALVIAGVILFVAGIEVRKQCRYLSTARNALGASIAGGAMVVVGLYLAVNQQIG